MKYFYIVLFVTVCIYFQYKNGTYDYWSHKWAVLLWGSAFVFSMKYFKKYGYLVGLSILYVLFQGIYTFGWFSNGYVVLGEAGFKILAYYSLVATVTFVLCLELTYNIKVEWYGIIDKVVAALCLANSVYIIIQYFVFDLHIYIGGFSGNGSINGSLIAFTFPILCHIVAQLRYVKWVIFVPICAIILTKTSVPVGTFCVSIFVYIFIHMKLLRHKLTYGLLCVTLLLLIGYYYDERGRFFNPEERWGIYLLTWHDWFIQGYQYAKGKFFHPNVWVGYGAGTFPVWSRVTQLAHNFRVTQHHMWLHNDWLQLLYEYGFIGLFLFGSVYVKAFVRSIKEPHVAACLAGYGACMVLNYPIHYAFHAMFGLYLLSRVLLNHREDPQIAL